ncbi:MAG: choice-of-anchor J domain-containing protein [Candidatus Cloacimonetes bacterium]|nr:choice-of-anchor J domain-containing protein [Candidatus Cloacimonadota bacterium]
MKIGTFILTILILGSIIQISAQSRIQENLETTIMTTNPDPEQFPNITFEEYRKLHPLTKANSYQELNYVSSKAKDTENFLILVDEFIESEINSVLLTYQQDLANENLSSFLVSVSGNTGEALKAIILNYYNSENIVGAILIGHLPSVWYEYEKHDSLGVPNGVWADFPCELFYSDMDGVWVDNDLDGIYDEHTGNIHPDIWLGRIKGDNLYISSKTEIEMIIDYFNRNHYFRNGIAITSDVGLVYVDDDWQSSGSTYQSALENVYSNTVLVNTSQATNADDYMDNRLIGNYEFIQVMAHSSPNHHSFRVVDGSDTTYAHVLDSDIVTIKPVANFYNLFACSNARFENNNCMGNMYLMDNYHCLNVIGTTKTGSMLNFADFYEPLSQSKTFGQAFNEWWQDNIDAPEAPYDQVHWFYGNLILGDPTLFVDYPSDPSVCLWTGASSNDWHNAGNWLFNNVPTFDDDVIIPSVSQNSPFIFLNNAQCKNLNIESGAILTLTGYSLDVYEDMQVYGGFNMTSGSSELEVHGNIRWNSGSTAIITSDMANINVHGSFGFDFGADVQITYGTINLIGSSNSGIWSKSSVSYVNNLKILKSNAQVSNGSEFSGDFDINGDLTIGANSTLLNPYSNCGIVLKGDLLCYGNYYLATGTFTFDGSNQLIISNSGDYFYDLDINSTEGAFILNDIVIQDDLTINTGATLSLTGYNLNVYDNMIINGVFNMTHDDSNVTIQGFMEWNSGSTSIIAAELATINVYGNFGFDSGADVQMENGTVKLFGTSNSWIWSKSSICYVNNLYIVKTNAQVGNGSEFSGDFHINGDLTIGAISTLTNPFPNCGLVLKGDINCYGNFHLDVSTFIFSGTFQDINSTSGDYFNDVIINSPTIVDLNTNITIKGDLLIDFGSLQTNSNDIDIEGNWTNNTGPLLGFLQANGAVTFNGTDDQYCYGEQFNELIIDKSAEEFIIPSGSTVSCDSYNWEDGFLTVNGGTFTANDLYHHNIVGSYQLISGQIDLHQDASHYIDFNGDIIIYDGNFNIHGGATDCWFAHTDEAYLYMEGGTLDVKDWGIHIDDGHSFSHVISGGTIKMNGGFSSYRHDFAPTGGYIHLYGSDDETIDLGWENKLHHLVINKTVSRNSDKQVFRKAKSKINNRRRKKEKINNTRSGLVGLSDDLIINGNMEITSGQFNLAGHTLQIGGSLAIYGALKMINPLDFIDITNDVVWRSGSTEVITAGEISIGRDWYFKEGCNATLGAGNTVRFTGNGVSDMFIEEFDNAAFGNVIVDKTGNYLKRDTSHSAHTVIYGDLILNENNEFQAAYCDVSGELFMDNGSLLTLLSGSMTVESDVECNGHLNIDNESFTASDDFLLSSTGEMTLDGGNCTLSKSYTGNYMRFLGTLNILNNGFLQISREGIRFNSTPNMDGGVIRVGWGFQANFPGGFQPTGGTIQMYGPVSASIEMDSTNYFHNLMIYRYDYSGVCSLSDDITINNDLYIDDGTLNSSGNELTVMNDIFIGVEGVLDPDDQLVKIGGNWTNNRGSFGFVEGTGTVRLIGNDEGTILSDETFYNLELQRYTGELYYTDLAAGITVQVENDFNINNGKLLLNENSTLDIDHNLTMQNGTAMRIIDGVNGVNINIGQNLYDYNNDNSNYTSFIPGNSTVTFDGNSAQNLYVNRSNYQFGSFVINKTGGNFVPYTDLTIEGDLNIQNGVWYNPWTAMNHVFKKDVYICDSGWFDNMGTVYFDGAAEATFDRIGGSNFFHNVIISKSDARTENENRAIETLTLLSDLVCLNDGNLTINDGTLDANGKNIDCTGNLNISYGTLALNGSSILTMGEYKSIAVSSGGTLETLGSLENNANIKNENPNAYHIFDIESSGNILAENTIFENSGYNGIHIKSGATVGSNGDYEFTNCTFTNGTGGGYLLTIDNSQDMEITNAIFPENTWGSYANVMKNVDVGNVDFVGATGDFAGESYDEDMYNRIDWIAGPQIEIFIEYIPSDSLIFGDVFVGIADTLMMSISNSGGVNLTGSFTTPDGYTASEIIYRDGNTKTHKVINKNFRNVLSFDIPAGNMVDYEVIFEPIVMQNYDNDLVISHNAGFDDYLVQCIGSGVEARLTYDPAVFNKVLEIGESNNENLALGNDGNLDIDYLAYVEYEGEVTTIIDEGFESGFPPTGWSLESLDTWGNWEQSSMNSYSGSNSALADPMMVDDACIITPFFTATADCILKYWIRAYDLSFYWDDAYFDIEISTDGSNWTTFKSYSQDEFAEVYILKGLSLGAYAGQSIKIAFRIRNNMMGSGINIDDVTITGDSSPIYSWLSLDSGYNINGTIPVGTPDVDVTVGFNSTGLSDGDYYAYIRLLSNDTSNPYDNIPVVLSVGTYDMTITPSSLDFGEIVVGANDVKQFTIENTGTLELDGEITTPTGYTVEEDFPTRTGSSKRILRNSIFYHLFPGESFDYNVTFSPTEIQNYDGNIQIVISGDDDQLLPVYGSGISPTPPDAPANLTIEISGDDVTLTWDSVTGADSYKVYSSDDPAGGWILEQGNISGLSWNKTIPATNKFYYVTANTGAIRGTRK